QAVYEIDKKGNFTFLNQTAIKIWGFTKSELKNGLSSLQTLIPEDRPRAINNINKLFSGSKLEVNEYTAIKRDGTTLPIIIYGSPKYKNGEIVGTRGVVVDISKLKNIEKTLLKSQQKFSSLFKSNPEALVYLDDKGIILDANLRFCELFGYTLDEVKGENFDGGMIHPSDRVEEAKRVTEKALKGNFYYETIRNKKDGTLFPVAISGSQVIINGKLQGLMALFQDITEREQSEKVQQVLYNISRSANSNISLKELYPIIHKELHKIIDATNFHISLLNKNKSFFSYYSDEKDDLNQISKSGTTDNLAVYISRSGKSILVNYKQIMEMGSQKKIKLSQLGTLTKNVLLLGVPLKIKDNIIGSMAVLTYDNPRLFNEKDIKLMEFVSEQVATAIERKRTEEALQASQQEYSNLFNGSPEAAIYHDEEGIILNINPRFTELFGYTLAEIKGKNINEGMIFPQNKTIKESEKLTRLALEGKVVTRETIRKKKDNSLISVIISVAKVTTEGQYRGVFAFYKDITERKKTEEKLRQNEEKFAGIFKNIPDAVFYQNTKGTILDINPRFTEFFGYTKEDILGKNIDEIGLYPKGRIKEGKDLTRKTLNEDLTNFETVRQKKDGTLISVRISTSFVKIKNKVAGIIGLYQDITEREQSEKVQQVLYNISKAANSSISLGQLYKTIHQELGNIIDTSNFYIALIDENKDELYFPYHIDEKDDNFPIQKFSTSNVLTAQVMKTAKPLFNTSKEYEKMIASGELNPMGSTSPQSIWLGVPLKIEGHVMGAMAVQNYTNPNLYSKRDIKLMEFVSEQVATAIERKRMEEELKKLAHHDPLTGTYSRTYGLELIQRQVKLAKRNKTSFLLAYADLDNLKKINDEFGHEEGDKALIQMANFFQSILREVDIIIRIGGDEFLLIFPDSSLKEIPIINERFNDNLIKLNQTIKKPYKIGFSIGVSCYDPDNPQSADELIRIADKKMYKEKKGKKCK
ncbi:MAG TPA: PAS domain S-box protein, partial [Atribacterota bacterium]|nr:PAS domain S-box protein [Atribacterota bacterium]